MNDKIRTSEKVKSKSASPKKSIKEISINSSYQEVDEFLKKRYGYGIWNFLYCLYETVVLFRIFKAKKEIKVLQDKIKKLKSSKEKLIENIDQFLIDTDIWDGIKIKYPELNLKWTAENRKKFIVKYFSLDRFFKPIDERVDRIDYKVKFLELYGPRITRLRVRPRNLVMLVWSNVMTKGKNEDDVDFENISALLNWFSINRNWKVFFEDSLLISPQTPKLTLNRYVKFSKDNFYDELAFYYYVECFPDIAEPLTREFPDPYELSKLEARGTYEIAESKLKEIFNKQLHLKISEGS